MIKTDKILYSGILPSVSPVLQAANQPLHLYIPRRQCHLKITSRPTFFICNEPRRKIVIFTWLTFQQQIYWVVGMVTMRVSLFRSPKHYYFLRLNIFIVSLQDFCRQSMTLRAYLAQSCGSDMCGTPLSYLETTQFRAPLNQNFNETPFTIIIDTSVMESA